MKDLRNATLVFLVKKQQGETTEICLSLKKRGFGANRWNGVGGKVNEPHETVEEAARRETQEEIGVLAKGLMKAAESEEMKPAWFSLAEIPFKDMWPNDTFWLPKVLKGNRLKAMFQFGEGDVVQEKEINIVDGFEG